MKINLDLHKQIENDLVKRSSLAQSLIKQLNKKLKELENKQTHKVGLNVNESIGQSGNGSMSVSQINSIVPSRQSSRV